MNALEEMFFLAREPDISKRFAIVTRDPLSQEHFSKIAPGDCAIGIYDLSESKERKMSKTYCTLDVMIEFYYKVMLGDNKSDQLSRVLADCEAVIMSDPQVKQTATNMYETNNRVDIDGVSDKIINGFIRVEIQYTHGVSSPFTDIC